MPGFFFVHFAKNSGPKKLSFLAKLRPFSPKLSSFFPQNSGFRIFTKEMRKKGLKILRNFDVLDKVCLFLVKVELKLTKTQVISRKTQI